MRVVISLAILMAWISVAAWQPGFRLIGAEGRYIISIQFSYYKILSLSRYQY